MYMSVIKDSGERQYYSGHPAQVQFYQLMLIEQLMFSPPSGGYSVNRVLGILLYGGNTVTVFTLSDRNTKIRMHQWIFFILLLPSKGSLCNTQKPTLWHQLLKKE